MAYEWTVFATMTSVVVAVVALLATALFHQGAKVDRLSDRIDRLSDRIDQRFERVDQRFDGVEARLRDDKGELLGRLDVIAERVIRLEAG